MSVYLTGISAEFCCGISSLLFLCIYAMSVTFLSLNVAKILLICMINCNPKGSIKPTFCGKLVKF